jgi:RNA recognition motif-containing protein
VIRNHETQESKGFAFVEAPTADEMAAIIRRFDRAPLEDRLLRANPAQPPKGKEPVKGAPPQQAGVPGAQRTQPGGQQQRPDRRRRGGKDREQSPRSAFATELAKVL